MNRVQALLHAQWRDHGVERRHGARCRSRAASSATRASSSARCSSTATRTACRTRVSRAAGRARRPRGRHLRDHRRRRQVQLLRNLQPHARRQGRPHDAARGREARGDQRAQPGRCRQPHRRPQGGRAASRRLRRRRLRRAAGRRGQGAPTRRRPGDELAASRGTQLQTEKPRDRPIAKALPASGRRAGRAPRRASARRAHRTPPLADAGIHVGRARIEPARRARRRRRASRHAPRVRARRSSRSRT